MKMQRPKNEPAKELECPDFWIETSDSIARRCQFESDGRLYLVRESNHWFVYVDGNACLDMMVDV